MIEATGICARVGGRPVLIDVDLRLSPGEMVGLIGPNGAGKTTLLRIMAGLVAPERGEVRYGGELASSIAPAALALQRAYLAQDDGLEVPLRVERLVALGRLPHRRAFSSATAQDARAVENALANADIAHLRDRSFDRLSGGERRRVLLARALAVEAPLMLADEPVAALDPNHQLQVMELLAKSRDRGAGVLVVLHDLTLASRFCDRLALIDGGRLVATGAPSSVLTDDLLQRTYGITVERGERNGEPWLLPWKRI